MTLVIDPDRWVRERISDLQGCLQGLREKPSARPDDRPDKLETIDSRERWRKVRRGLFEQLVAEQPIERGTWQALDVKGSELHRTHELNGLTFALSVPQSHLDLQYLVGPDLPWAEDHFLERVSGFPMNPAPSEEWWPYAVRGNGDHKEGGRFDHTYPERYWPKYAGQTTNGVALTSLIGPIKPLAGVRFEYGDLADVVETLRQNPMTRQAVLAVWFPEDQWAARHGKRVPCSLTYHFLASQPGVLDVHYAIRSCDFYRHMTNDVYMTSRLLQWVTWAIGYPGDVSWRAGHLVMTVNNLHLFAGDVEKARATL